MIVDALDRSALYESMVPGMVAAFGFLRRADLPTLTDGRHEIVGDTVYASISRLPGKERSAARLEAHDRYLDIQYLIVGAETLGWSVRGAATHPVAPYDSARDIVFFQEAPQFWFSLQPGQFAIFFPQDAHAPMVGDGPIHKVVVKIRVDG